MGGVYIRLQLILKLWLRSYYAILLMILIPIVALIIYSQNTYTIQALASIVFEETAPIWLLLILHWCLAIDIDSKFHMQVMTYPIAREKYLLEKLLFSTLIFMSLLGLVTLALTSFMGIFAWQSFIFTIPIYVSFAGIVLAGTMLGNHSLGGILAGISFWMFYEFGGTFLGNLNVILLEHGSVYTFVKGEAGFLVEQNYWILYNRLFYLVIGVLLIGLAVLQFNRKTA